MKYNFISTSKAPDLTKIDESIQNFSTSVGINYKELVKDLYNISKDDDNITMKLIESKYNESDDINEHNKIYLFDNINIDKEDYINIVKKIIPNINDILNLELNNIKKAFTFEDINSIFKKYSLSSNHSNS
jgi:hypothetical protein